MSTPRAEFTAGIKALIPILVGVIPFGMIYGVLAIAAGIPALTAQAMSIIVFAGASQVVATQMIAAGLPGIIIILTTSVVNLRHLLYSASIAPFLRRLRTAWKWWLAYLLTDEAFAFAIKNFQPSDNPASNHSADHKHWYFFGAGLTLWSAWQLSTAAGIFLGVLIPETWSLDFTIVLTFIALLVPSLQERANAVAALVAGAMATILIGLPMKLGLLIAALVGIFAGLLSEGRT